MNKFKSDNDSDNTILTPENVAAVFGINKRRKAPREYSLNKTIYCMYSGLPVQTSGFLKGKHNIHCQAHWIFNQKAEIILDYMKDAKSYEDKLLTQLAALVTMDLLEIKAPMSCEARIIHSAHEHLFKVFLAWNEQTAKKRQAFSTYCPSYVIREIKTNNVPSYQNYIKALTINVTEFLDRDLTAYVQEVLGINNELSDFEKVLDMEMAIFRDTYSYSKKVGRQLLEGLASNPTNTELHENYTKCIAFLLNDGYRKPANLARVFVILRNCTMPKDEPFLQKKLDLTLEYLETEINKMLDFESQFFGKKKFNSKSGNIRSNASISSIEGLFLDDEEPKDPLQLKTPVKLKLKLDFSKK